MIETLSQLFPGISTLFIQDTVIAITRVVLIGVGFLLAYLGFNRTLEPLIMVPMGIGMIAINAGVLFLEAGRIGTIFIDPLVAEAVPLVDIMQINFLQPIYNLTFSNGLIACLVFFGIGARSEISFILARPWSSITIALFAEMGTFVTLVIAILVFGLSPWHAAAVATIGGADGPMVLFASLMLAPELFVPISIIAYLYLSLTYAGYPYIIKLLVPKKYRGIDIEVEVPEVSKKSKFIFTVMTCALLCILLPVAAPLIMSFFLGVAIKEAEIQPYQEFLEGPITYGSTLFLGLLLGVLCEASTILNPVVGTIVILGILALAVSGLGGLLGGWLIYWINKRNYNPVIGIAGVSCIPTTAKIAQKVASEENPFCVIMPLAMGAGVGGLIVSAIAVGVFITTLFMIV
ncbi:MAG: Na+-transporting malonate decarboxylase, carboxybiotin decarboxylase subunit [Bacillota bacterium]